MSIRASSAVLAFAVTACSGSQPGPGKTNVPAVPAAAAAAAAAPTKDKLDCDALVPASVRAALLAGATVEPAFMDAASGMCQVKKGDQLVDGIAYDCRRTTTLASFRDKMAEELTRGGSAKELPGIGRAAFGSKNNVEFYDDDADCAVSLSNNIGGKAPELAAELAKALRPELVPAAPRGKLALDCQKLLPPAVVEQVAPGAKIKAASSQADQMNCELQPAGGMPTAISYMCNGKFDQGWLAEFKKASAGSKGPVEDVKVGTGGVYTSPGGFGHSVTFVDGETGCLVSVLLMKGDKAQTVKTASIVEAALDDKSVR